MYFSGPTILAFLSASSLAAAQYSNMQRRYAEPMDIYARDAYADDLYAREDYGSHLYARDPYASQLYARAAYLEHLYRRDKTLTAAQATAMEQANMAQLLKNPTEANREKFNKEAAKEQHIADGYKLKMKAAGTSDAEKKQLQEAITALESDDLPPGYTNAQLKAAGFSSTTKNPDQKNKKNH